MPVLFGFSPNHLQQTKQQNTRKLAIKVSSNNNTVNAVRSLLDTLASGAALPLWPFPPNPMQLLSCDGNDLWMDYLFFYHVLPDIRV